MDAKELAEKLESEIYEAYANEHGPCRSGIAGSLAAAIEQAASEALEAAYSLVCKNCSKGDQIHDCGANYMPENPEFRFQHRVFPPHAPEGRYVECRASALRAKAGERPGR